MHRSLVVVVVSLSACLAACSKGAPPPATMGATVAPAQGIYLRSGFDKDPSSYIGRFLPSENTDVDESNGMQLTCSKHISYKEVDAGGVQYDEVFNASTAVSARIGVPLVAGISGGHSQSQAVRVRYVLERKMVSEIDDPAAFEACCKAAPDQCTDRFIGEFYGGTGEVFYAADSGTGGKGNGRTNAVLADVEVHNGMSWARSVQFPNPVYFAFKTAPNLWTGAQDAGCGAWTDAPPRSTQGHYFVGMSDPKTTEASARETALADARAQTVRWAGTAIAEGTLTVHVADGARAAVREGIVDERRMATASDGIARLVKDESWCVTTQPTPEGQLHVAKVLAFLPKAAEEEAAKVVADAVTAE